MSFKNRIRAAACAAVVAVAVSSHADVLTTSDGQSVVGTVEKTATGYVVHTGTGDRSFDAASVKHVMYDHAADRTKPTPAPATGRRKKMDPRTVALLLQQGGAAVTAGDYPTARDSFLDVLAVDPANLDAAHGVGVAYLRLASPYKAVAPLESAAKSAPADRDVLLALANSLVQTKNPMRAVKFAKGYLEAHADPVDEPMLNAMGAALQNTADTAAAKGSLFAQAVKLYYKLNGKLEAARPGEKRWGAEWKPAADVDKLTADRAAADRVAADTSAKLASATAEEKSAEAADYQVEHAFSGSTPIDRTNANDPGLRRRQQMNEHSTAVTAAQERVTRAKSAQADAQAAFDKAAGASADLARPVFPTDVDTVLAPPTAIASAVVKPAVPEVKTAPPVTPNDPAAAPVEPAEIPSRPPVAAAPVKPTPPARVTRYAAAFAVSPDLIVAPASVVDGEVEMHVDPAVGPSLAATVVRVDPVAGLALVRVTDGNFPCLKIAAGPATGPVVCVGFPNVDLFNPIAETINTSSAPSGDKTKMKLEFPPRLPSAPVVQDGVVIGVETAGRDTDPAEVPVVGWEVIAKFVGGDARCDQSIKSLKPAVVQLVADR